MAQHGEPHCRSAIASRAKAGATMVEHVPENGNDPMLCTSGRSWNHENTIALDIILKTFTRYVHTGRDPNHGILPVYIVRTWRLSLNWDGFLYAAYGRMSGTEPSSENRPEDAARKMITDHDNFVVQLLKAKDGQVAKMILIH